MPLFAEPTKYIYFHNDTDLPVLIDAWVDGSNTLKTIRIKPFESSVIHSSVGEWHMHAMFDDDVDNALWKDRGLGKYYHMIGKFRSDPCASGNYSWMEYRHFICDYRDYSIDSDPRVKGQIKFSIANELCFTNN
jgi:hypothetical protein